MRSMILLLALAVAGCSGTMQLSPRDGGSSGTGALNTGAKTMDVTLDGKKYSGNYVVNAAHVSGGTGVALLRAPDGDTIRCEFQANNVRAIGVCTTRAGRVFDMEASRG